MIRVYERICEFIFHVILCCELCRRAGQPSAGTPTTITPVDTAVVVLYDSAMSLQK